MKAVLEDVKKERTRQDRKWGKDRDLPPRTWHLVLSEEVGEVANAILEGDYDGYREELTQVAAVAIAALENLNRYEQSEQYKYEYESPQDHLRE